jgi:hypothetical protein
MSTVIERYNGIPPLAEVSREHARVSAERWDAFNRRHIGTPILRRDIPKVLKELRANGGKGHVRIDANGKAYRHE